MSDTIAIQISGMGIIFYSPVVMEGVPEGTDYFKTGFTSEEQVQSRIQNGTLVGFATGSPGRFLLKFHDGYPSDTELATFRYKLRLGILCTGGVVYFRDLFDLLDWYPDCPPEQQLPLADGIYHVTLCSNRPPSGILGDDQTIEFYLNKLDSFPRLAKEGIPTLCMD